MFGIESSEFLVVALVALLVIGPKDLPRLLREVGRWVAKGRAMTRHVRSGFDEMMRQSELDEMQKLWAAQNEAIMKASAAPDAAPLAPTGLPAASSDASDDWMAPPAPPLMTGPQPTPVQPAPVQPATLPPAAASLATSPPDDISSGDTPSAVPAAPSAA